MIGSYEQWEQGISEAFTRDALWRVQVYRFALYLGDLCWHDVSALVRDRRTISLADQLYRAVGSVSANIAEGYSRSSGKDRVRFYEYALGSARESRDWYHKGRFVLETSTVEQRLDLLARIIRLLLTMIPEQRQTNIRETGADYFTESDSSL